MPLPDDLNDPLPDDVADVDPSWVPQALRRLESMARRANNMEVRVSVSTKSDSDTEDISPYLNYLEAFNEAGCVLFMQTLRMIWDDLSKADKKRIAYLLDSNDPSNLDKLPDPPEGFSNE